MDKGNKRQRAVELLKDILIVLLACSALWLVVRSQILGPLGLQEETPHAGGNKTQVSAGMDAARPLRASVSLMGETGPGLCGIQCDQAGMDSLFQQVAGLLAEILSSAGAPEQVTRRQWEQALTTPPSVCLDFQGELPMSVLAGWITGEQQESQARVRRLVLTVWKDWVALYYQDVEDGSYYRCLSEVANTLHLTEALANLQDNGAFYAFESDQYGWLDPDTLLTQNLPTPAVYQAANPVSEGQAGLESVLEALGVPVSSSSFYSVGDEWVARVGGDNLRLSSRGVLEYHAEEGSGLFPAAQPEQGNSLFETVETCRRLAAAAVGSSAGQARLYCAALREGAEGLEVEFDYCLNGVPVRLEEGAAAWFLVEDGQITRFILRFRSYTDSGETTVLLPLPQAAAAMEALDLEGEELLLVYNDGGGERVSAGWAALSRVEQKGG